MKAYIISIVIPSAFCPHIRRCLTAENTEEALAKANQLIKEKNWNAYVRAVYERVWINEEKE